METTIKQVKNDNKMKYGSENDIIHKNNDYRENGNEKD